MHEAIYLVIGAFLAGIVGIVTGYFSRWRAQVTDREYICRALEAEISQNQDLIRGYVANYTEPIQTEIILDIDKIQKLFEFIGGMHFQKNVFMGLYGKLGLLNKETIKKVFQYYKTISIVEIAFSRLILVLYCSKDKQEMINARESFVKSAENAYQKGKNALKGLDAF